MFGFKVRNRKRAQIEVIFSIWKKKQKKTTTTTIKNISKRAESKNKFKNKIEKKKFLNSKLQQKKKKKKCAFSLKSQRVYLNFLDHVLSIHSIMAEYAVMWMRMAEYSY